MPKYNIYHLFDGDEQVTQVLQILACRRSQYLVAKQYHLLQGEVPTKEFNSYVADTLNKRLANLGRTIGAKTTNFNVELAFSCLCKTIEYLFDQGIHPFLISGTLLGMERDGKLLAQDNDIDLGIFATETNIDTVVRVLRESDQFESVYQLKYMIQATDRNGIRVDVFFHYHENGRVWHGTDVHRWYNSTFTVTEKFYLGRPFLVPSDPALYLEENYGDWRSPVVFWDYSFDTPNQEFAYTKKAAFFLLERVISELDRANPCRYEVESGVTALQETFDIDVGVRLHSRKDVVYKKGR